MMKNLLKVVTLVVLIAVAAGAHAQKATKIGHVDFAKVLEQMPGQDTVKTVMEKYVQSLQGELQTMQSELELKNADYQKNAATMSNIIKSTKEKEMMDLQDRIQAFQQSAQKELSDKQTELITPFVNKAKQAIKDVAKEGGFAYILNGVEDILLYSEGGEDVTPLVKKKLGIK
ncbi:MAG TPA: OmpH family outer membrane protein [Bacteroidales bacterium]|jgi:outer membrane protein|nr:OmpH family outer membrane protein [Bacteroidales bacterium]